MATSKPEDKFNYIMATSKPEDKFYEFRRNLNRIISTMTLGSEIFTNLVNTKCPTNKISSEIKILLENINTEKFKDVIVDLVFVGNNTLKTIDKQSSKDFFEVKKKIVLNIISIINNNKKLIDDIFFSIDKILNELISADNTLLQCLKNTVYYLIMLESVDSKKNKNARNLLNITDINTKLPRRENNFISYSEIKLVTDPDKNNLKYNDYVNNTETINEIISIDNKLCDAKKRTSDLQLHKWNLELYKFLSLLFPALTATFELDETSVNFMMYVGDTLKKLFIIIKKLTIFGVKFSYYFDKEVCKNTDLKLTKFSLQVYQLFKYYYINFMNYTVVFNNFKNKFTNVFEKNNDEILDHEIINNIVTSEKIDKNITVKVTNNPFFPSFKGVEGLTNTSSKKDNRVCLVLLIAILIVILLYIKLKN